MARTDGLHLPVTLTLDEADRAIDVIGRLVAELDATRTLADKLEEKRQHLAKRLALATRAKVQR